MKSPQANTPTYSLMNDRVRPSIESKRLVRQINQSPTFDICQLLQTIEKNIIIFNYGTLINNFIQQFRLFSNCFPNNKLTMQLFHSSPYSMIQDWRP